ncbi:MAG: 16S rRNA (guanine(527)-N(7))-methyltransferase RsmG [Gammaproteobacteria bacterium]
MLIKKLLDSSGLKLQKTTLEDLEKYLDLLSKWNKTRNLVSRNLSKVELAEQVFDCVCLFEEIKENMILDVGSGAGLPGMIIAIMDRKRMIRLLEPNQKKVSFLRHVQAELDLENIFIVKDRLENCKISPQELIVTRAFAEPNKFLEMLSIENHEGGKIIMMVSENTEIKKAGWISNYKTSQAEKTLEKKRGFLNIFHNKN